jgi:uncharacterized membrane protein YkoI
MRLDVGIHVKPSTKEVLMKSVIRLALISVALSSVPAWALFESDRELSDKARITMIQALKTAQRKVPGKPVEVDMGKDDGRVVYKIEIIDKNKNTKKVYIDAETGKVHTVKD